MVLLHTADVLMNAYKEITVIMKPACQKPFSCPFHLALAFFIQSFSALTMNLCYLCFLLGGVVWERMVKNSRHQEKD